MPKAGASSALEREPGWGWVRAYGARRGGAGVAATSAAGGGHVRLGEHARGRGERGFEEKKRKKYEPFIFHLSVALSLRPCLVVAGFGAVGNPEAL